MSVILGILSPINHGMGKLSWTAASNSQLGALVDTCTCTSSNHGLVKCI